MEPSKRNCHLGSFCESGNLQVLLVSGRQDLNLRPPAGQVRYQTRFPVVGGS